MFVPCCERVNLFSSCKRLQISVAREWRLQKAMLEILKPAYPLTSMPKMPFKRTSKTGYCHPSGN
jgi:hypothetical protein